MSDNGRRYIAPGYLWGYMRRRRYYLAIVATLAGLTAILLEFSSSLPEYGKNLSLNLGADLIGTIIVLFLIAPFLERSEIRRDSVLERFDHRAFIQQAADARHRIMILELWTDLLQGNYQRPFLASIKEALQQNVEVRMLLLDPDTSAAEQRAEDLLQKTEVVDNIMDNLRILHEFVRGLPKHLQENIQIRVYSALPPVQLYRVDDHLMVSFYPVNVTSWNAAQYQTGPRAQLGEFVSKKFDELWDAHSTRALDQFQEITIKIDSGEDEMRYQVQFVKSEEEICVSGREIAASHLKSGIGDLPVRIIHGNAQGELEESGLYFFVPLDVTSEDHSNTQKMFSRKYGQDRYEVILKLVEAPAE